jgi:hypothetical protein
MVKLIARRAIFKTKAGGTLRVTQMEARVLKALKLADEVPAAQPRYAAPASKTKAAATYKRRDMVAEPAPVVEPADKIVATMPKWVGAAPKVDA